MKIKNIKEEVTQDMENLRKKNQTQKTKQQWKATSADWSKWKTGFQNLKLK
jgi:hypothetical protein